MDKISDNSMNGIITMLQQYHIKFDQVTDTTLRIYGNFQGYSVVRTAAHGIETDGKILTKPEFESWLFAIST